MGYCKIISHFGTESAPGFPDGIPDPADSILNYDSDDDSAESDSEDDFPGRVDPLILKMI